MDWVHLNYVQYCLFGKSSWFSLNENMQCFIQIVTIFGLDFIGYCSGQRDVAPRYFFNEGLITSSTGNAVSQELSAGNPFTNCLSTESDLAEDIPSKGAHVQWWLMCSINLGHSGQTQDSSEVPFEQQKSSWRLPFGLHRSSTSFCWTLLLSPSLHNY